MIVGAAEEPETIGQDLQRAFPVHQAVSFEPLFEDPHDQVFALHFRLEFDLFLFGHIAQLFDAHLLQFIEMNRLGRSFGSLSLRATIPVVPLARGQATDQRIGKGLGHRHRFAPFIQFSQSPLGFRADLLAVAG